MMFRLTRTGFGVGSASVVLVAIALCIAPVATANPPSASADADSVEVFPAKERSRDTWEYAVNAPFKLAFLPVKILFKGSEGTIRWVTDNEIPRRVHDFLISDDGRTGVIPIVTPRRGYGAKFFRRGWMSPNSKLTIHARAGLNRRQDYGVELKRVALLDDILTWGFYAGYEFASDERFYGLGMDTDPDDDKTNYAHERWEGEVRLGKPFGEYFHLGGEFGIEHNNILEGRDNKSPSTPAEFPGLTGIDDNEVRFSRAQIVLEFDNRDTAGSTTKGWLASVGGGYYKELEEDDYEFTKFNADIRTYLNMFYKRVLMLRVATELTTEASGSTVPFYYLSELGRYETIRGFSHGRFRGTDAIMASLEYSWPVGRLTDFLLFADAGEVLDDLKDFESKDVEVGWGGGLRVSSRDSVIARLLFGKSRDEWRLYFAMN